MRNVMRKNASNYFRLQYETTSSFRLISLVNNHHYHHHYLAFKQQEKLRRQKRINEIPGLPIQGLEGAKEKLLEDG